MWRVSLFVLVACGAVFAPKRKAAPDVWALQAAVLHSMTTAPAAFIASPPDCSAAPTPDLALFCKHDCDAIGELSLQAYCAWRCDDIKNPDLAVMCKLEKTRDEGARVPTACDAIGDARLLAHCKRWIAAVAR